MSKSKNSTNTLSKSYKIKIQENKNEKENKINDNEDYNYLLNKLDDDLLDDIIEEKLEIDSKKSHEEFETSKPKIKEKSNESSLLKSLNKKNDSEIKKKKLEEFLNLNNEIDPNELPKVTKMNSVNFDKLDNIETKIKNGKSSKYYERLEERIQN